MASGLRLANLAMSETPLTSIDVLIEGGDWNATVPGARELCRGAVEAALSLAAQIAQPVEVSVLLTGDEALAKLNREYRGREGPTNVLSFSVADPSVLGDAAVAQAPVLLGDVAVAYETAVAEANLAGLAIEDHMRHLVVHGVLHLLGYDHVDDSDAERMEALEVSVLAQIGVEDPYKDEKLFVA